MSVQIVKRAPQTRCYKCGVLQIVNVCHHCGQAMCAQHSRHATKSIEFAKLGLKDTRCGETPIHCEHCAHVIRVSGTRLIVIGALVGLVSLILMRGSFGLGLLGLLIAGCLVGANYFIKWSRPALPVLPRFDTVKVRETLRGTIVLGSDGCYHISSVPAEGVLTIAATFDKTERDRLRRYRKAYRRAKAEDMLFHAGFAVLRGPADLVFRDGSGDGSNSATVIPLTGQVSALSVFDETNDRGSGEWRVSRRYSLLEPVANSTLPIRLAASLVPEEVRRTLELELQWAASGSPKTKLAVDRIGLFEVRVPLAWGEIEYLNDSNNALKATVPGAKDGDVPMRSITWRRLPVDEKERQNGRRSFFIRFEKPIDLDGALSGRIDVTFKRTLSRLEGVDLFYPLGKRLAEEQEHTRASREEPEDADLADGGREEDRADIRTQVLVDFELSLAGLRYQDIRIVPDPKKEQDRERQQTKIFQGLSPNYVTIIALTNALSDQAFYVKQVIENPPRTGERAYLANRYWDIAGRYYNGVYPIDYHLILTGEEIYGGSGREQGGTTKRTLTVQAEYANADMEAQIENVWERLANLVDETLHQRSHVALTVVSVDGQQPAQLAVGMPDVAISNVDTERITVLTKRLDQLTEALLAGRISETMYQELKARTEQELRNLQFGA